MANKKISDLPAANPLTGAEETVVVQDGEDRRTPTQDIADLGGGSTGLLTTSLIPVNSVQILALHSSPIELIAAPGLNKAIWPISSFGIYTFGTIAYTADSVDFWFDFGASTEFGGTSINTALVRSSSQVFGSPLGFDGADAATEIINKSLTLYAPYSDPTNGDGSLVVQILYKIIDLS